MAASNPFLDPRRVQAALRGLEMRPTRGMGQNFLIDPQALATIVAAANIQPTDLLVEVGPGIGVLTWELIQHSPYVLAVELDKRLAARLHEEFYTTRSEPAPRSPQIHLVQADVLHVPPLDLLADARQAWQRHGLALPDWQHPPPYKVVANLPYAITSPVLQHFLHSPHPPQCMVVLVQWEVAERIAAEAGDMSMRAHAIQIYAEPHIVARVPASSFLPAPAVDSAVLRLDVRPAPAIVGDDPEAVLKIIKAGFLQPRKKLSNGLTGGLAALGMPLAQGQVVAALHAAHVDPTRRAETLSLDEWVAVYRALQQATRRAAP